MTGDLLFWLGWLGTAVLYVVMIFIAWRALFGDRGKGRRRCPRCWHDLSHTLGMTCGECGFVAERETQFHKTRRHKSLALLAILICLGPAVYLNWKIDQRGWSGVVPTKVLIWTLPLTIEDGGEMVVELERRIRSDELSDGELLSVLRRCASGDSWCAPASDEWAQTYGDMLRSLRRQLTASLALEVAAEQSAGELDGPAARFAHELEELLLSVPPKVDLTTRTYWPVDVTPRVNVSLDDWWPTDCEARLKLRPAVDGAREVIVHRTSDYRPNVPYSMPVPTELFEDETPAIDVAVERRRGRDGKWELVHEQQITAKSIDDDVAGEKSDEESGPVMAGASNDALDSAMRRTFNTGIVQWPNGPSPVRFRVNIPATAGLEFTDTVIGVKVELKRDGELARRLDLWWLGGNAIDRRYGFEIAYENIELLKSLQGFVAPANPETGPNWSLTVTGVEAIAHRAGPAARYWSGQIELPMVLQAQPGIAPSRPWWTEEQLVEEAAGEYSALD